MEVQFFHLGWESANRYAKLLSYFVKAFRTLWLLSKQRPSFVILQLPPTPALYVCALYVRIAKIPLIVDCHNAAIMEHWRRWPLTGALLRRATVLAHNDHVAALAAQSFDLEPVVLRTGIMSADPDAARGDETLKRLGLPSRGYVLLPWSLHTDEPIEEALSAMRQMPEQRFVLTGDPRKLDPALASDLPANVSVPGYLPTADFNELFAHAAAVLVLTTRDLTQLSGMAEAMAFEIPAVISDTKTTRYLYETAPVYVSNEPESIRAGLEEVLRTREVRIAELKTLRSRTEKEFERQVRTLIKTIGDLRAPVVAAAEVE